MIKRIKLLTLLQLSDRFKFKKIENVKSLLARIGMITLLFGCITAICTVLFLVMNSIVMIETTDILTFVIFFLQILSIVSCTVGLLKTLYSSKDNMILLSYPAHHVEVFLSKLLVFYIYEFLKSTFITLPLIIGFGIIYKMISVPYIIATIVMVIVLPVLPVLIGALLTIPILFIKRLINKFPIIKVILLVLAMVLLFYVLYLIMQLIPVPLRIVALFNRFVTGVKAFIADVNSYSLFYQNIGDIILGKNVLINYLVLLGVLVGLVVLVSVLSMPLYFSLASKSNEQANVKKHKGGNIAHKNTFFTFVKKEWLLSIRNFDEFVSNYIFMFATPYVLFVMVSIFSAIDRNQLGMYMTTVFTGFIALIMCCASNTSSALAITKEGSEFVLLKTVPSDSSNMAWAKIFFNLISSSVMLIISFVVVYIFCQKTVVLEKVTIEVVPFQDGTIWLMLLAVLCINAGLVFWSFQIDIMNPKLREYASSGDTSSMNNASKSILVGLIISVLFAALALIFLLDGENMLWNWGRILGFAIVFLFARLYLFISHLKNVFPYIEY